MKYMHLFIYLFVYLSNFDCWVILLLIKTTIYLFIYFCNIDWALHE